MSFKTSQLTFVSAFLLTLTSITLLNSAFASERIGITQNKSGNQYPADFVANFMRNCQQNTIQRRFSSLPRATAEELSRDICSCMVDRFEQSYTLAQFRQLINNSNTDPKARQTLVSVGEACANEVLYE